MSSIEGLSALRAVFVKENGTVTAGNASGINDGAAAVLMMSGEALKSSGAKPLARLVAYAHAGVDPKDYGHRTCSCDPGGDETGWFDS